MKEKILISIFIIICFIPLLTMGVQNSQDTANEVLHQLPELYDEEGNFNVSYLSDFSDYFNDNFGLRKLMISAQHRLVGAVFGESSEEKVILGKDGWLFYEETLDDFEGTNLMSDREIYSLCKSLSLMAEYCESNGMKFVFTIAPNKNSLYGDKMPWFYPESQFESNAQRLKNALSDGNVNYVDLFEAFKNEEKTLYRKSDSHWTNEGAGLAADNLLKAIDKDFVPWYNSETKQVEAKVGDLYEMLYLADDDSDTDNVYNREHTFEYERQIRSVEDNFIYTVSEGKDGCLFMFRDSFGNTLYPYLADEYGRAVFTRLIPYNLNLPLNEGADTVAVEIVERNLAWILEKPPIFPSLRRDTGDYHVVNADVIKTVCDELPGYFKIEGTITDSINSKVSIYVIVNDAVFEAVPWCNNGFVAYVPDSFDGDVTVALSGN